MPLKQEFLLAEDGSGNLWQRDHPMEIRNRESVRALCGGGDGRDKTGGRIGVDGESADLDSEEGVIVSQESDNLLLAKIGLALFDPVLIQAKKIGR